jgi:hypothetical protein
LEERLGLREADQVRGDRSWRPRSDVERDLIRTRTAEGLSRAQKRGQQMGRPSKLTEAQKGRGTAATGGGCYACRTRAQLRCGKAHDFAADSVKFIKNDG